jgi:hypothetical protein
MPRAGLTLISVPDPETDLFARRVCFFIPAEVHLFMVGLSKKARFHDVCSSSPESIAWFVAHLLGRNVGHFHPRP